MLRIACEGSALDEDVTINGKFKDQCPADIPVTAGTAQIRAVKHVGDHQELACEREIALPKRPGKYVFEKINRAHLSKQFATIVACAPDDPCPAHE